MAMVIVDGVKRYGSRGRAEGVRGGRRLSSGRSGRFGSALLGECSALGLEWGDSVDWSHKRVDI